MKKQRIYEITNPDKKLGETILIDASFLADLDDEIVKIRGEIIQSFLVVNQYINLAISNIFFPEDNEKRIRFTNEVLETDFFTFPSKIKLMLKLVQGYNILDGNWITTTKKLLKKVNSIRNNFSHGNIHIKGNTPYLQYYSGGKQNEEKLDRHYIENVMSDINKATDIIQELLSKINPSLVQTKEVNVVLPFTQESPIMGE